MSGVEADRERLGQSEMLAWLRRDLPMVEMGTVYLSDRGDQHNHAVFCALIPNGCIERSLGDLSWDLAEGQGLPGAVKYGLHEGAKVSYLRFGNTDGVEPLVFCRGFHGIRDDYIEISEEFRHFHQLYHERKQDHYSKIDGDGAEHVVAIIEPGRVQIRIKEIRQFLAIKEMHLAVQFDCREHSSHSLEALGLEEGGEDKRDGLFVWGLHFGDLRGVGADRAFSRLLGKRLVPPVAKEKSGFWGFAKEEPRKHVDFIIGIDENGDEVTHTCDPDQLANFFGANPGAPNYLTAVHFRKEVLDKYYQQPSKYSVESGILRCGSLWSMYIDNHFTDRVAAWLGDLGRGLPYQEQLHWRSHNIAPVGGVSETYFRRQVLAIATDSDRPEHEFQRLYGRLHGACNESTGWQILLPLAAEDAHCLQALRIPATDEQRDFDDLVLALTKILVDSLNEKELNRLIPSAERSEVKGSVSRLERALQECGMPDFEDHIQFLRNLQSLRSAGTAHRKGSNYQKIAREFRVDSQSLRSVFGGILIRGLRLLEFLEKAVRSGLLSPEEQRGVEEK